MVISSKQTQSRNNREKSKNKKKYLGLFLDTVFETLFLY